jgi:hypothetical protein
MPTATTTRRALAALATTALVALPLAADPAGATSNGLPGLVEGPGKGWGLGSNGEQTIGALPSGVRWRTLSAGAGLTLGLRSDGLVVAQGGIEPYAVPPLPTGTTYTQVSAGSGFGLATRSDGEVVAITNSGSPIEPTTIPDPAPGTTWKQAAAGQGTSVLVQSDGRVVGLGSIEQYPEPVPPPGIGYTKVAALAGAASALRSDGRIVSWGSASDGKTAVPTLPPGTQYIDLDGQGGLTGAVRSDGHVVFWGRQGTGFTPPTQVPPAGVVYTGVAVGEDFVLVLRSDGQVEALHADAANTYGTPTTLAANRAYVGIDAGTAHGVGVYAERPTLTYTLPTTVERGDDVELTVRVDGAPTTATGDVAVLLGDVTDPEAAFDSATIDAGYATVSVDTADLPLGIVPVWVRYGGSTRVASLLERRFVRITLDPADRVRPVLRLTGSTRVRAGSKAVVSVAMTRLDGMPPGGTVRLQQGGRTVATATYAPGRTKVVLRSAALRRPGKARLTVAFAGSTELKPASTTRTITVVRRRR